MNSNTLLTHIRLEQRCLIGIDKKLHELEYLLPSSDPIQFFEVAKNTALLSERSTAQLRNFLFTICGGMPQDYYLQAAEMQGIRVDVTDGFCLSGCLRCYLKRHAPRASNSCNQRFMPH